MSFDKLYSQARQINPEMQAEYVYFPTQPEKKFSVRGNLMGQNDLFAGGNSIVFDAQIGKLLKIGTFENLSFPDKLEALAFPLHAGNFGGHFLKILYIFIGLTPGLLSITGFLLWWRRKSKPTFL